MPINKDQSSLPKRETTTPTQTWPPDRPMILPAAVDAWWADWQEREGFVRPMSIEDRKFRASWASKACDRALWYAIVGEPETNPTTTSGHWRMAAGTLVHELLDRYFTAALPPPHVVEVERAVDLSVLGVSGAATADLYVTHPDWQRPLVCETKSVSGYPFKLAVTRFRGRGPEGPKDDHVIQGALAAAAEGADLRILYIALENLSASGIGKDMEDWRRFCAEWVVPYEQCVEIAQAAVARVNSLINDPFVPARVLRDPELGEGHAYVSDPRQGTVTIAHTDGGVEYTSTWRCAYCGQRDRCLRDG